MNKKIIVLLIILLIVIVALGFLLLKANIFIPFESNKLTSITSISEYKKLAKENITKIEVSHGEEIIKTLTKSSDMEALIRSINDISGYRISVEKATMGSLYAIKFYTEDNIFLTLSMSHRDFRIVKGDNIKYYKLKTDYLETILTLLELENAEG